MDVDDEYSIRFEAIFTLLTTPNITLEPDTFGPELWMQFAGLRLERFRRYGRMKDLIQAVEEGKFAVAHTSEHHEAFTQRLHKLGFILGSLYERTGKIENLEEAIRVTREAIKATPENHSDLGMLNTLANQLGSRYDRKGNIEDLEQAIQLAYQVVKATPEDDSDYVASLHDLGNQLTRQYEHTSKTKDFEEAIRTIRQAVKTASEDHPHYAICLHNLGNILGSRHEHTGNIEDLEEAIRAIRQAVKATPKDHPTHVVCLNNLGNRLESRYKRKGKIEDLEEAIQMARQTIKATPEDHPNLASMLNALGNHLDRRYKRTENIEDLEEAIRVTRQAMKTMPEDHLVHAMCLNNLEHKLASRYKRTKEIDDLEEAIQVARQAVKATPEDYPDLARRLNNLGTQLESRYERKGKIEDLEEGIRVARQAWECRNAVPFIRVVASFLALRLLQSRGDFGEAYELSKETINLLAYVHNRSLDHQDQQYVVEQFSGLAAGACSLALQSEKSTEVALEILEQGRGVILGLLINDRSDTSKLNAAYPQLFAHYESLRIGLNKPVEDLADSHLREIASKRRTDAISELEKCIEHIQQLPGFEDFQKSLTAKQMQNCSTKGSIVVVNITDLRSDAIIITTNGFKALSFSALCARQATDWIDQDLSTASQSDRGRKNKAYLQFLSWLWRECVKPVLDELHCYVPPSEDDMPRVWWVGTGLATSFPFHSAGDSSAGLTESAFYRVISSYSSTIKALQHARRRVINANSSCGDPSNLLVVTMPETPGAEPLQGARAERSEIMAAVGSSISVETLEYPDVASVMARLQQCDIAHFACHGVSNPVDPSESGLILQTATEEPRQDILSVRIACQADLAHAKIAYLSACSTAQNRAVSLSDEVLHLVSGFQVAGFRHVVGCLWPSDDNVCVDVAKSFYSELSQNGSIRYDDRAVAFALHKAVVKIRESDQYRKRPLLWAQFVHFGA